MTKSHPNDSRCFCTRHHVRTSQVIPHDFDAEIASRPHHGPDSFFVGAAHHDDVCRPRLGHKPGFQIPAVHNFYVGDDGHIGEFTAQGANAIRPFGDNKRGSGFQPVHARTQGKVRGFQRLGNMNHIKGKSVR